VEENSVRTITRQNTWGFEYQVRQLVQQSVEKEE